MRLGSAARHDRPWQAEEERIPAAPAPAPGKRPRTARLVGGPEVAAEPARPVDGERRTRGEAGRGSFMPPVGELRAARAEEPAAGPDATDETDPALEDGEESPEAEIEAEGEEAIAADGEEEIELVAPDLVVADPPPAGLDAAAIEEELGSAIEAVPAPAGPDGMRVHLTRVAEIAGARRRAAQADVDLENAELDLEEEAVAQRAAGRRQDEVTVLAEKRTGKEGAARTRHAARLHTRATSRDELKQQLVAAQASEKQRAAEMLTEKTVDLETRLAGQLAALLEEEKARDAAIAAELATANAALALRIEEKKKAHEIQIEREQIALQAQAANEKVSVRAEAANQAGDITASADAQAAYTLTESTIHAGNVEAKASREAQKAVDAGETKARQAVQAASDRADTAGADEAEKSSIAAEGEWRASQARLQAAVRAAEIRHDGDEEAAGIREKGKADSTAEKERGRVEAAAAVERGEAGARRIEDELAAGIATMQLQSTMAVAEMETERALAMAQLEQKRVLALAEMATQLALAAVAIEKERTAGVVALHAEHEKLVADIDRRITADLAKVDASGEKDLARLQRRIDRDLAAIDRQVKQAERRMQSRVDRAEAKATADVARRRTAVRKAARAVLGAIDGVVARAERAIDTSDQDTSREISDAAHVGVHSVAAEGQEVRDDNRTASEAAIREQEDAARTARSETSQLATDAATAMEEDRKALDDDIDQTWVADALARSGALLSRDGTDWAVTDDESVAAMHLLASLPPHLQGQVIDGLSDDEFEELLSEMDDERKEDLQPLVDNTHDPARKLELWGAYHTSMAANDAAESGDGWRVDIADETEDEVEEEVEFLRQKLADGSLTEADVLALATRKRLEHEIEMEHRVNLTNEREGFLGGSSVGADGDKIVWDVGELLQVRAALGEVPEDAVRGNEELETIRREDLDADDEGQPKPTIGGDHADWFDRIRIYDLGVTGTYRHTNDVRVSGDPGAYRDVGPLIGRLEETLVHEIGHDVHDKNGEIFEKFQAAAGWEKGIDEDELAARGLTDAQMQAMKEKDAMFTVNGRVYSYAYGEFLSHDEGRIPSTGQGKDTWRYARTNHKDHFAETYMKANLVPEQLAQDLLDEPADRVARQTLQRDLAAAASATAKANFAALQAASPPPPLADLAAAFEIWVTSEVHGAREQNLLDDASADQEGLKEQYRIMRDDILHTGEEVASAKARLEAKGITPARLQDFLDRAARLSTPEQVKRLEATYP